MTIDMSPEALVRYRSLYPGEMAQAMINALEEARAQRDAEHDRFLTESGAAIFMADLARLRAQLEEARGDAMRAVQALEDENAELRTQLKEARAKLVDARIMLDAVRAERQSPSPNPAETEQAGSPKHPPAGGEPAAPNG